MDAQAVGTKEVDAHHDADGASSERKHRRHGEKGKRDNSTSSRKRSSIREGSSRRRSSSAAACGAGTRSEDQNNKDDGLDEEPAATRSDRSRSKRESSTALAVPPPATLTAGEVADKNTEKRKTSSLPSPSRAKSGGTDGSASLGTAEKKERRRRRNGSSSSYSAAHDLAQPQEEGVTSSVPATPASHAIQDSKRPKRGRSSRTLSTDDVDGGDEETRTAPSTGATADKTYCCPNATSFTTGKRDDDSHSESVVAQNRGLLLAEKGQPETKPATPRVQCDEHPAKIMVAGSHTQGSANTLVGGLNGGRGVKDAKASSQERDALDRRHSSRRRRGDGEAQGGKINESDGSEGGGVVSRRQRSSTTDERPKEKQAVARRVSLSPSSALGVHVVDRGATKQVVLTANDPAAGESKPGSSSDRSRDSTTSVRNKRCTRSSRVHKAEKSDAHSHHQEKKQLHRRRQNPSGSGQEEPSLSFQGNFATAVMVRCEGNTVHPPITKERSYDRTDQTSKRGSYQQEPLGHAVSLAMESMEKNRHRDSAYNCETKPVELSKTNKNVPVSSAADTASPPRHALLAPSFSVVEDTKGVVTPPPDIPPSEGDPWGDCGSPLTARSASSLGRLVPERTARYVLQQESFHADIPDGYIDLASPVRKLERAEEEAARGPPADRSSHWAVAAGPNKTQRETERTPPTGFLSLTPSEVVWGRSSSDCGRKSGREEGSADCTERKPRASSNPVPTGGDLGPSGRTKGGGGQEAKLDELSLPTRWRPIEACYLAEEDGKARSDQNERRHERGVTPPLSQARSESVLRGSPREPTGNNLEGDGGADGDMMLFRTDVSRHLVSGEQPALFFLRPSESLCVTRIEGIGRLLVTLREEAGSAAAVVIDGATVHDSAAHFGHEAIQTDHRFPYVAGHRYEFQVAPAQGVELAVRGGGGGEGRQGAEAFQGCATNTTSGLHVVFSVMSAYSKGARVCQKDAMRLSLRTFEAPTANDSRQPTKPKSPPTAMTTKDPPTLAAASSTFAAAAAAATADEGISAPRRPSLKEQDPAGDHRRTTSPSVAAVLLAPCLSPLPEAKQNHLIGAAPRDEPSVPTAGVPPAAAAPAAAPEIPQPSSSTRTVAAAAEGGDVRGGVWGGPVQSAETRGGNQPAGAATRGQRQPGFGVDPDSARCATTSGRPPPSGMEGSAHPSAARLRWNTAWEQQRLLPPSPSAPAEMLPPSHAPSLPHIRRHVDSSSFNSNASPRSTLGQLEPSGVAGSHHVPRDPAIGAPHRYVLPPGYRAHEHPVQSKRYVGAEDEPDTPAVRHYQHAREERHHGATRHHHHRYVSDGQRDVASPGHQAGEGSRELEWNRGRRKERHTSGRGYHVSPEQTVANSGGRRPSRWRDEEEDGEDWTRNGRPGLTRRSAPQEDLLAAAAGGGYVSQAATGGGHNGEEYPGPYRFHHGSRKHKASLQSDDNSGGYKYGGGCLPPSGKARWEPKKTVGVAVSPDPSRRRAVAATGVAMGRKAAGEQSALEWTEEEAYHARNGGGYVESLIAGKAPRNRGLNEDGWYGGEPGRQRTENNIGRQPPGRRNPRQDNTGGPARQTGITTSVVTTRPERMPPRWIKF